ncbi:MAG TPA: serine/threonine-protein kinase [Pseudonocardia sp.]
MQEFGQYQIEDLIGSGGMGEVYRAFDTQRDRQVALKVLSAALSEDPEYQRSFRRESEAVARLREPHVVPIHDFGEIEGRLFVDMLLVEGLNLAALLAAGPMAPAHAVNLTSQVADALDAAHDDGVVHRDVKPSNILLTSNDFAYVVDFGLAHGVGHTRSRLTMTEASLDYMAPERFESDPVDPRTDVYSLACVLFECLTGQKPFAGDDLPALMFAHLHAVPRPVSDVNPAAGSTLDAVVAKGMAKRPADRYPSAGALATAARAALAAGAAEQTEHLEEAPRRIEIDGDADFVIPRQRVAAPVPVGAGVGTALLEHGGGRGTELRRDPPDPATVAAEAFDFDFDRARPAGPPPPGETPPGEPYGRPSYRLPDLSMARPVYRHAIVVVLAVLTLLAAVGASTAVWLLSRGQAPQQRVPSASASVPAANGPAIISAPLGPLARSVDTPTVGPTVQANSTPGYMQVAPNGRYAYIANREAGVLSVFDTTRNAVTGTINVPQGGPQFVTFAPDGKRAYVSIYNNNRTVNVVGVLDTATSKFVTMVPVGVRPFALDVTPDGKRVYVPNHDSGSISVIDTATDDVIDTIKVAPNPHWVDISTDGKTVYAADHESNVVSVIDATTDKVLTTIPVGLSPHSILKHPTKPLLFNVNYDGSSMTVIDTNTDKVVRTVRTGGHPQDVSLSADGEHLYIAAVDDNAIQVFSLKTMSITARVPVGHNPTSIAVGRDGRQAYATNLDDGTVTVLNLAGPA